MDESSLASPIQVEAQEGSEGSAHSTCGSRSSKSVQLDESTCGSSRTTQPHDNQGTRRTPSICPVPNICRVPSRARSIRAEPKVRQTSPGAQREPKPQRASPVTLPSAPREQKALRALSVASPFSQREPKAQRAPPVASPGAPREPTAQRALSVASPFSQREPKAQRASHVASQGALKEPKALRPLSVASPGTSPVDKRQDELTTYSHRPKSREAWADERGGLGEERDFPPSVVDMNRNFDFDRVGYDIFSATTSLGVPPFSREPPTIVDIGMKRPVNDGNVSVATSISNSRSTVASLIPKSVKAMFATSAATVQSQHSKIPASNLAYWSSLSVRSAIAVIEAKGSEKIAKKVANSVLDAGRNKPPPTKSSLRTLATKISVLVLEAGGDHNVAAAVVVTIMNNEKGGYDDMNISGSGSSSQSGTKLSLSEKFPSVVNPDQLSELVDTRSDHRSSRSDTPSMKSARRKLKEKEIEITNKLKALETAELLNQEKEKEISERMDALDVAAAEMIDKVNTMQHEMEEKQKIVSQENGGDKVADAESNSGTSFNMKCYWCGGI